MAAYDIEVVTQDGASVHIECAEDEDVITAGLRQDVILMASCREGGCATCKADCTDGDYEMGKVSVQALPPDEEEEGVVLLCRCYPRSDMTVEVPYTSERISYTKVDREFTAEIISITPIASNAVQFVLRRSRKDDGSTHAAIFEPGQFFDIEIPGTDVWRSFSPCSLPNDNGDFEFLIRVLPDGKFSNFLRSDAKPGLVVNVRGSSGNFYLHNNGLQPRYFVAGGTGLSPVMSMLRQMHDRGDPNEARLYYGVNKQEEVFYADEIAALSKKMPNLTAQICVWHAEEGWTGAKGNAVEILKSDLEANGAKPDMYLCGPPGMVDATNQMCDSLGIPRENVCSEKFLASGSSGE